MLIVGDFLRENNSEGWEECPLQIVGDFFQKICSENICLFTRWLSSEFFSISKFSFFL